MKDDELLLVVVLLALAGVVGWLWWRGYLGKILGTELAPAPGEHPTIRGASLATFVDPATPSKAFETFKFAPVAATAAVAREWAPGYEQGPRGTVSVTYKS